MAEERYIDRRIALPVVRRVEDENGNTHIEPPLNQEWGEAEQLAWKAAVVADEIGLPVTLSSHADTIRADQFGIGVGRSSTASYGFRSAWTLLNGITLGAREARRLASESSGDGESRD